MSKLRLRADMYEIKAKLPRLDGLGDQVRYELVALFEAHDQDCTCGIVKGNVLGYVDEGYVIRSDNFVTEACVER